MAILAVCQVFVTQGADLFRASLPIVDSSLTLVTGSYFTNGSYAGTYTNWVGANTNYNVGTATNGFYPASIAAGSNVVNIIPINVSGGKDVAVQFSASATAATGATNTANLVLYQSTMNPVLAYDTATGSMTNATPITPFAELTIILTGTTSVSTNVNYSSTSTPAKGAVPYLYVYSIGVAAGAVLTNYSVFVRKE